MKSIFHFSLFLLCGVFILQSCSKINEPYYTVKAVYVDTTKRAVLLEDYTGHLCVNCAPAGQMANALQELYHGQVYVIAVHAGSFARPDDTKYYPYLIGDYTCATGNDWNGSPLFNIVANPTGMVNRKPWKGVMSFVPSEWTGAIQAAVTLPKVAVMSMTNAFDIEHKTLTTTVATRFLIKYSGQVTLTACILEDSIYGGQLNNIKPDSVPIIKNYRFMHMLRGSMNESFGQTIATNPAATQYISTPLVTFPFKSDWNPDHCSVIAFLSDANTKEVLHVIKSPVLK